MKESKTTYAYLIEHMQEPSFQKIWDIAYDFVRKLPSDLCDELHDSLNKGIDILDSEPLLQMYIYAFGKMHNAKLQYAFEHLHKNAVNYNEIEIVDYGCGQGLATICYHDFILEHNIEQSVKRITLIDPSEMSLSRAELLCSRFFPNAKIIAINKHFDDLLKDDLVISPQFPTIHLLSNIIDVESYDIVHFSQIVKEKSVGDNEYIVVSPMQNTQRIRRIKTFASTIEKEVYFEEYFDKREFDKEKDWTCAVLLCSNSIKRNIVVLDCNKVLDEAVSFHKRTNNRNNDEYSKELFYKLQICSRFGDKRCQNQLGLWFYWGLGTDKNYDLTLEWLFKSAMQENAAAYKNIVLLYNLIDCYNTGHPFDKVFEYFDKKKLNGDAENKYFLALCYYYGIGVDANEELSFYWFNESARQGDIRASHELGVCYLNGYGVEVDIEEAIHFFTIAALAGNKKSIIKIIELFRKRLGVEYFGNEQFDVFVKAAQLGIEYVRVVTQSFLDKDKECYEDNNGVQYSIEGKRLLKINMYFDPSK